jgi:hypothetical protein
MIGEHNEKAPKNWGFTEYEIDELEQFGMI